MKRVQKQQLTHGKDATSLDIASFEGVNPKRPRIEKAIETSAPRDIMKSYEEFADSQVWLTERSGPDDGKIDEMPCIIYPVFLEETDKCAWLLKGSNGDFAMVTADNGDDTSMIQHDDGSRAHTKAVESYFANILNSPNVTWIKPKSNKAPVGVSRHHQQKSPQVVPSGSTKDWLRKSPACPQDEQSTNVQENNTCSTSQKPAKPVEIEDPTGLACVQETPTRATVPCPGPCQPKTSPGSTDTPESSKNQWLKQDPPCAEGPPTAEEVEMEKSDEFREWLVSETNPTSDCESNIISSFLKCQSEEYPKKLSEDTISESWLLGGEKTKTGEKSMAVPQQEVTENWLLAHASGFTHFKTRAIGFPYFTIPTDVNQWLQK
ncbi:uncharacterized protein [Diadema antillarum]|uniref:uncharacterized protein n=1 Tax=Diadema antillarum TaxID=105358 RepID=UPI003A84E05E